MKIKVHLLISGDIKFWQLIATFLLLPFINVAQSTTFSRQLAPREVAKADVNTILSDSYGFIWYGGSGGAFKHNGYTIKSYKSGIEDTSKVSISTVWALIEGSNGNIWLGSRNGLFCYNRETDQVRKMFSGKFPNPDGKPSQIRSLYEDGRGQLWVGGEYNIYLIPDTEGEEVYTLSLPVIDSSSPTIRNLFNSIVPDNKGSIYLGSNSGLWEVRNDNTLVCHLPESFKDQSSTFSISDAEMGQADSLWLIGTQGVWAFDTKNKTFSQLKLPAHSNKLGREIYIGPQNKMWIAGRNEMFIRDARGRLSEFLHNSHYLVESGIKSIIEDRFGNLWIGSNHGIGILDLYPDKKISFYQAGNGSPFQDNFFFRVMQDSAGGFWFRMYGTGLGYNPPNSNEFKILLQPIAFSTNEEIKNFCLDIEGNVWVITYSSGLYLFKNGQEKYQHFDIGEYQATSGAIISSHENPNYIWFSTNKGLCRFDRITLKHEWFYPQNDLPWLDNNIVGQMTQADDGNIWLDVRAKGKRIIGFFDIKENRFSADPDLADQSDNTMIFQFKNVAKNEIWVATPINLIIINTKEKKQRIWNNENGFPTKGLQAVTPDQHGNIWFTHNNKIYRYDGMEFNVYVAHENIGSFANTSSALTRDGKVIFGGSNGLQMFDPKKIEKDTILPIIYLSGFQVFNKKRQLGKALELVKTIKLDYEDKVFTLEYSGLHYLQSQRIKYKHKLVGIDKEWVERESDNRRATYSNLSPGKYTFKVIASNAEGYETTEEEGLNIQLIILPPWYRSWWAYIIWISTFLGTLYGIYRFQLSRQLARAEALRLLELDEVKNKLYTNITHEFRTPLTVIQVVTDRIRTKAEQNKDEGIVEDTRLVKRNSAQLLRLINQMLDLRKLESGNMSLHYVQGDIIPYFKYLLESFHTLAEIKGIQLHFLSAVDELIMDYDPEKIQHIISNLLSNAIKFTSEKGHVYFTIDHANRSEEGNELLFIKVEDTGLGIPTEKIPRIFDRFYQVDDTSTRKGEGTGIGLTLTRELIKLLDGQIEVKSKVGKGTTFKIALPVRRTAEAQSIPAIPAIKLEATGFEMGISVPDVQAHEIVEEPSGNPIALIVEDNLDVLQYLSSALKLNYQLLTATDGKKGIELAIEKTPDIIISDVMMPEKDGLELCDTLKNDVRTSHIPIVLLTAKADIASKIEGLRKGADAYLPKPFNKEELFATLENLLEIRKKLQLRFQTLSPQLEEEEIEAHTIENAFLKEVRSQLEAKLSNAEYGVMHLSRDMKMSRSQLFRKLKALTGQSTALFIRSIRLQKAKELLSDPQLNVSEIAYEVGFTDPAYFTRAFGEVYGQSPTQFRSGR